MLYKKFGAKISIILDAKFNKGGASPRLGGLDERPPTQSKLSGSKASEPVARWVPPSALRRDAGTPSVRHDNIFRRVRGILNKLTPEKFDKLSLELLNVGIDSPVILKGVILLIFEKALEEPKYSKLYAQLCHRLCEDVPNFEPPSSTISSFRRLLLHKCQDEFENRSKATEAFDKKDGPLTEEESEQYHVAKEKMLGNIKFIGELGKLEMLHEGILHKCIQQLLEKKKNTPIRDMAEDLECLCQIMRTVGPRLDTSKAKTWIDQYFSRIEIYSANEDLPSRIRFMLQDVIELRENEWKPRRVAIENGPKTISAIREEATGNGRGGSKVFVPHMNGMGQPWKAMGDIFSMPVGNMSNTIGTGPGVIQVDNFAPQFAGNIGGGMGGGGGRGGSAMGHRGNQHNQGYQNNYRRGNKENNSNSPKSQRRNNNSPQDQGRNSPSDQRQMNRNPQNQGRISPSDQRRISSNPQNQGRNSPSDQRRNTSGNPSNQGRNSPTNPRRNNSNPQNQGRNSPPNQRRNNSPPNQRRNNSPYSQRRNNSPHSQRRNNQNQQHHNPQHNQPPHNRQAGMGQRENLPPRFQRMAQQQQQQHQTAQGGKPSGHQMQPQRMGPGGPGTGGSDMGINMMPTSVPKPVGGLVNGKEEVSLRPQKNFMFKPNTPAMLPRSAQSAPSVPHVPQPGSMLVSPRRMAVDVANPPINPILNKQPQITIKPAKEEKPKPRKKEAITLDDLREKVPDLLKDISTQQNVANTMSSIKDLNVPKNLMPDFLSLLLIGCVSKTESEQDRVMELITALKADKMVSSDQFMDSFKKVADEMSALEQETPLVKSHVARFGAQAVALEIASLGELAEPFHNGVHYPLFLLCLQSAHRIKDKHWLVRVFNDSKINLQEMLPEIDQRKERMLEILDDRGLSFIFPLMRVQSELGRQIATEPTAGATFKWLKERVDSTLFTNPKFINILVTSVVKYITGESTLAENTDTTVAPEKPLCDKEKEFLDKLKGVLQRFLHDHIDLQVAALYAVQVFCYNHQFPKGMLLRFFMNMYDQEIIEEEAFLHWKEEVTDEYPGKGKALFQVNQWLTWLEQAEEESEDEDEE